MHGGDRSPRGACRAPSGRRRARPPASRARRRGCAAHPRASAGHAASGWAAGATGGGGSNRSTLPVGSQRKGQRSARRRCAGRRRRGSLLPCAELARAPVPCREAVFQRLVAGVGVEIAGPVPAQRRAGRARPRPGSRARSATSDGGRRASSVNARPVTASGMTRTVPRMRDGTGTVSLVDVGSSARCRPRPARSAPIARMVGVPLQRAAAALGHRPAVAAGAVQRHVQRAVVLRVAGAAPPRQA